LGTLRIALAMTVLISHLPLVGWKILGGGLAVQCFFIISGFYMALILGEKYRDARLFYGNRLLRLMPSYFVATLLGMLTLFVFNASATAAPELYANTWQHPGRCFVVLFENLCLLGQELLFWFTFTPTTDLRFDAGGALPTGQVSLAWQLIFVPQAWSLSMELFFYALAPWLMRLGSRVLLAIAVASVALRLAGLALPVDYNIWQGRLFPTALFLFVLGMLAQRSLPRVARYSRRWGLLAAAVLLLVILTLPTFGLANESSRWLMYVLMTLGIPLAFNAFRHNAVDRWIGELSYPVYLTHLMIIGLVLHFEPPHPVWIAIGGTLALSIGLRYALEIPIDRRRQARALSFPRSPVVARPQTPLPQPN
jgi:peptidoglycan/LPS O-acetylase OafA/YrhL